MTKKNSILRSPKRKNREKERKAKERRVQEQYERMDIIDIVQNNEKAEGFNQTIVEEAFVFFGENSEFDIPPEEKTMLKLHKLKKLSDIVYGEANIGYGKPCSIKVYKEKLYIG